MSFKRLRKAMEKMRQMRKYMFWSSCVGPRSGSRTFAARLLAVSVVALASVPLGGAAAQELPKYELTGFRDARFGMSEQEVRAIVTKAFGLKQSDLTSAGNPVEGTTVLTARIPHLDPVPGPAQVAYIFGYSSKKLIQVNVIWGDDKATDQADSNALITAGTRLERYFAGFAWRKDATRAGIPVGDNTVVLFSGEDDKKGAVRLIADGVKYQMQREGNQTTSPEPKGPPKLILNYIADRNNPDVAKIEKGKF
jgi:hypothetical protein